MPYVTQAPDATEETERVQIEALRQMGMGKRVEMMRNMSRTQMQMDWDELRRDKPTLATRELQVKAVGLWYGQDLAKRLEAGLKQRGLWDQEPCRRPKS